MKERLDQLTLKDLIELSCGEYSVLNDRDEIPTVEEYTARVASIMSEYKSIATPVQARIELNDAEKVSKYGIKEKCARIAQTLCLSGHSEKAREILILLGIDAAHLQTDELILARCQSIIGEVDYEMKRLGEMKNKRKSKTRSVDQVRRSWYSEIASVMSIFRMSIDLDINAAIYANLVRQAVERSKAMAKMPPMARMFM